MAAVALALASAPADAAAKKKRKAPAKQAPAPKPVEQTPPVTPAAEVAPPPQPEPEPEPAAVAPPAAVPAAPAPVAAEAAPPLDASTLPAGFEVAATGGFGARNLTLTSASYATPFRIAFGYPSIAVGFTVYPLRLLRLGALTGLHVAASYSVGFVLQQLPLGGAQVFPSDGRVAVGYALDAGPLRLAPRAVYRVLVGGVARNALFDDAFFQSLGGELGLGLSLGGFSLQLAPRIGAVVDSGTQPVRGYGPSKLGLTWGGSASIGWRFASGVGLFGSYQLTVTRADFAGHGTRDIEAVSMADVVHAGFLSIGFER